MRAEADTAAAAGDGDVDADATVRPAAAPGRRPAPVRRPASLALRLTVSIGLAISVLFLALGWVIERAVDHHFVEQDADELAVVAQSLQQVLQQPTGPGAVADAAARLGRAVQGHHGMHWFVADARGQPVYAMDGPDLAALATRHPALPAVDADRLLEWAEDGQRYRGAVLQLVLALPGEPAWTAVVATDVGFHDHFLHGFRRAVWAATSVAGLLAIGLTWLAVHRGHAPLRRISAQISGVSASALHVRLDPAAVPIELQELAVSFNTMLERVEQDFRRLSHFSADIAHELRTPVTNLVTQTQVLLSRPRSADDYREALYSSLEEYERMSAMVSDMLYLAQTDHQLIRPAHEPVDLAAEVQALFEFFEPWAEERQVRLVLDDLTARATAAAGPPAARGDRLMLRRALSNLLGNAIRHTPAGQAVTVALRRDARGGVHLQVANPGEPIAAEHLPHLFDRFYRVDPSRQRKGDGAGLGLAIVKAIAEAHGGQVGVRSGPAGTVFEVQLPPSGGPGPEFPKHPAA